MVGAKIIIEKMQDLIIPGYALYLLGTLGLGLVYWLVYLTKATYKNQHDISLNTANDRTVADELEKLYKKLDETKNDLQRGFDKMEARVDAFISSELTMLKEIISKK